MKSQIEILTLIFYFIKKKEKIINRVITMIVNDFY